MEWMIKRLGLAMTMGLLAAAVGCVIFGLLAMTPFFPWHLAASGALGCGVGTWLVVGLFCLMDHLLDR